jgi:CRISPR-associated endonuclease Csn1
MLQCLAALKGDKEIREEKVRRFKMNDKALEEFLTTWNARQFIDSAYASRLAADYAGLLYGGREDADGNLRVQVRPGGLTKHFREAWRLNSILGDGETKNGGRTPKPRHDHRHHAIDAAVIAAANQEMFTRLSNAAKRRQLGRPGRFGDFDEPWPGFRSELKTEVLERVVASHRVSKKVSGALHEETIYSRFNADATKDSPLREPRLRQWINELSARDVENIADESVKLRVREKLAEVGGDPRKLPDPKDPANLQNLPYMIAKQDGRHIPIKRVRVKVRVQPVPIGAGHGQRYVKLGSNHHIEIYAETDKQGREQWKGEVVTMFEAYQRLKGRRGVVNPDAKANLVFSLAPGESVRFGEGSFKGQLFVMRGVTQEGGGRVFLVPINDARKKEEIVASKLYRREFISTLHEWKTRKVVVGPLGEVSEAHD